MRSCRRSWLVSSIGTITGGIAKRHRGSTSSERASRRISASYASWPDAQVIRGMLDDIQPKVRAAKLAHTALIFIGRVFDAHGFGNCRLYHLDHRHILRPR